MKNPIRGWCSTLCAGLVLPAALPAQPAGFDASIEFLYGNHELFPSAIVCFTGESKYAPSDETQLGDKKGIIAVKIKSPAPKSVARVTIGATAFFGESSTAVELEKAGQEYFVAPWILYDVEKLAGLKQPIANLVVKVTVEVNGRRRDFFEKIILHSVNDWLFSYVPRGGTLPDTNAKFMAAAYINENNPQVDRVITLHAFNQGKLKMLNGYVTDGSVPSATTKWSVAEGELSAVYDALRDMGFKYAALSQPSVVAGPNASKIKSQYVRLMGDAIESRQANGLEAAAILASVYRKMMLHTVLILFYNNINLRGEVLLGIYRTRDNDPKNLVVLDPRELGTGDFAQARRSGEEKFDKFREYLLPTGVSEQVRIVYEQLGYLWIDVDEARRQGVLPVPEPDSERELRGR